MPYPIILFLLLLSICISFGHSEVSITALNGHYHQYPLLETDDAPVSSSYRSPFPTFANVQHANCYSAVDLDIKPYDIAIIGAPFDTGTTGRSGARFGPHAIRRGSRRINALFGYSPYTHKNSLREWAQILDCGDAPLTYLDNTVALRTLEQMHNLVSSRTANSPNISQTPRILALGGDHTTTLPALRVVHQKWGKVAVVHFDSHLDTWNPKIIGGRLSDYAGHNHGTFLSWAHSEGLILNKSVHVGNRGRVSNPLYDLDHDRNCGFRILAARDIDRIGVEGVIKRIKDRVGQSNVYISVDIDVLDPAFAPGISHPFRLEIAF